MNKNFHINFSPIYFLLVFCFLTFIAETKADELVHEFKNPSFSGIGTSAHYLTVENQEKSRRDAIRDDIEAALNNHYVENNNIYDLKKIDKTSFNFFKLDDFSKYYLPEGVPNIYAPYFCKKYNEQIWDSFGNPVKNNNIPEACVANNNAYRKIFNAPYDAPGVLYSEDTNNYSWLFSFFSNAGIVTSDLS